MASSRSRRQTLEQNVIPEEEEYNSPIELDEELGAASMAEGMQGSSQKSKRKVQRTSTVWNYFDLEMGPNENGVIEERAICKVCKKSLTGKSSHETGHLLKHRKKCDVKYNGSVEPCQTMLQFSSDSSISTWFYDQQRARELHTKYMVNAQQPLDLVDDPAFE